MRVSRCVRITSRIWLRRGGVFWRRASRQILRSTRMGSWRGSMRIMGRGWRMFCRSRGSARWGLRRLMLTRRGLRLGRGTCGLRLTGGLVCSLVCVFIFLSFSFTFPSFRHLPGWLIGFFCLCLSIGIFNSSAAKQGFQRLGACWVGIGPARRLELHRPY